MSKRFTIQHLGRVRCGNCILMDKFGQKHLCTLDNEEIGNINYSHFCSTHKKREVKIRS